MAGRVVRLFGRDEAVAEVERALDDERAAGALITGPAGIGKSALADHVSRRFERRGAGILRVPCSDLASEVPLGAIAASLPPELIGSDVGVTVAFRKWLDEHDRPVVIVVDDVEGLDEGGCDALVNAAESGRARLLATHREGAVLPERLAGSVRAGRVCRLRCRPLEPRDVVELAEDLVGGSLDVASRERIVDLAAGNPLHVRELIAAAEETGSLRRDGDSFQLTAIPATADRLVDLVRDRIGALRPDQLDALTAIAAAGVAAPAELVDVATPGDLEALRGRGLVDVGLDRRRVRVSIADPMHREVLLAMRSPLAVRSLRDTLAGRIVELGSRRRDDQFRLAVWSLDGGRPVDLSVLLDASRTAYFGGDHELSRRLASAAFEREPSAEHARAIEAPLYELGDPESLDELYERWEPLIVSDRQRLDFEKARASGRYWRCRDPLAPRSLLARTESLASPAHRDQAVAQAASLLVTQGFVDEAVELGTPLLESAPGVAQIHATLAVAHGRRSQGAPEFAAGMLDVVVAAYRAAGPEAFVVPRSVLANISVHSLAEAGRFDDATAAWRDAIEAADHADSPTARGLAMLALAWMAVLRGRIREVESAADDARRWLAAARHPGMQRWAVIAQGLGRVQAGDIEGARHSVGELERLGPHPAAIFEQHAERLLAWIEHHDGDVEGALERLRRGANDAAAVGNRTAALGCLHDAARLGRASDVIGQLEKLVSDPFEGTYLPLVVDHVRAAAAGDGRAIEELVDRFDSAGLQNLASEVAMSLAELAERSGDQRAAARWLARGEGLRGELGLASPVVDPVVAASLTERELEIATVAARGESSRAIGERLGISVRTVDNHLGRVYRKLHVESRMSLRAVLHRAPSGEAG